MRLTRTEKHGFPGDHRGQGAAKENWVGVFCVGSQSVLPTLLSRPLLSQPRVLDDGTEPGAVSTLPPCSGRPDSLGEGLSPTQTQPERGLDPGLRAKGAGKGWPSEPAGESPAPGAVPTHLAREIVARTAGRGALGGLSIPGGSGSRHARHVPWTRGELGLVAGEGQRRDRPALGSTPSSHPPPPRPGPRQAPPSVRSPRRHLPRAGRLARAPTTAGQRLRGRRAPSKLARLRALRTRAKSGPRTGPPRSPAARARFPGERSLEIQLASRGLASRGPEVPHPGSRCRCAERPAGGARAPASWRPTGVPRSRLWGRSEGSGALVLRGGVHCEEGAQAVLLLLTHPGASSSEYNFIYPPKFSLRPIYIVVFHGPWWALGL